MDRTAAELSLDKHRAEPSPTGAGRCTPPRSRCWKNALGPGAPAPAGCGCAPSRGGRRGGVRRESGRHAWRVGGRFRASRAARDLGAAARACLLPRTPGAEAALWRGHDPGGDRRADRRLPDAGLPPDPPSAHPSARRPGRAFATQEFMRVCYRPLALLGVVLDRDVVQLVVGHRRPRLEIRSHRSNISRSQGHCRLQTRPSNASPSSIAPALTSNKREEARSRNARRQSMGSSLLFAGNCTI